MSKRRSKPASEEQAASPPPDEGLAAVVRIGWKLHNDTIGRITRSYVDTHLVPGLNAQRARRPRPDALQKLIISIVKTAQRISSDALLQQLRLRIGHGVIESITGDSIEWNDADGKVDDTPIRALKDRLLRAKTAIGKEKVSR